MSHPLSGKVAIVTGGSRGIGAAITRRLARDGADVAFSYASNTARAEEIAASISSAGVRALPIQADQADPVAVAKFVRTEVLPHARPRHGGPLAGNHTSAIQPSRPVTIILRRRVSLTAVAHLA